MKRIKWGISKLIAGLALLSWPLFLSGEHSNAVRSTTRQPMPVDLPLPEYELANLNADTLMISPKDTNMHKFLGELRSLRSGKDTVINIVHLGDSHLQAGYLTGKAMRLLQSTFGNAGRGWLTPYRLARTNAPDDYSIISNLKSWTSGKCIQAHPKTEIGIGGLGIKTTSSPIKFNVSISERYGEEYGFNRLVVYRDYDSSPMMPADNNDVAVKYRPSIKDNVQGLRADTFYLASPSMTLHLESSSDDCSSSTYYGFNVMNGNPGILYHMIGVNGARYSSYNDDEYVRQLSLLHPALIIISLGTNDSFGRFDSDTFEDQVSEMVHLIKKNIPSAAILLETPPGSFLRSRTRVVTRVRRKKGRRRRTVTSSRLSYRVNNYTEVAEASIISVAHRENISCFDLFGVSGGADAVPDWLKAGLLSRDRVHYNSKGYYEQATLLVRALLHSYNSTLDSHANRQH